MDQASATPTFFQTQEPGRLTRRLRTLVVSPSGVLGGAECWLLSNLDAAVDRLDVRVIMLADGPLRTELERRGIPVMVRPTGRRRRDIALAVLGLRRDLKRLDPDVVVANGVKAAVVACPAARLVGVRSVWVKHDHSFDGRISRTLGRLATRVVATAPAVAAAAGRDDVVIIEPARPATPLPRDEALAKLAATSIHLPTYRPVLAMLGRYIPYKGIDTAIKALSAPGADHWHLLVMGDAEPNHPHERERLAKLAAEVGVADRVELAGYLPQAGRLLAAAHALAALTRDDGGPGREGYGMAAAEAMAAGIPVIAPDDNGPIAQRIGADASGAVAGLLVQADDPGQVAAALSTLSGPVLREAMGDEGRRRIHAQPNAVSCGRRFAAVLAETALRPGAGLASGPGLSIVAPVFNEEPVIERLLKLVIPQLSPVDEFLLVDGGSTDNTVAVISEYAARDGRVKLIHNGGGNIANNRNVGVNHAYHPFIACIDVGCDPSANWVSSFRAAAAEIALSTEDSPGMVLGVYHVGSRVDKPFAQVMPAVAWADPVELRRPTIFRRLYGKLLGRTFSPNRVDGRSVGFTRDAFDAAGGFPEYLDTAEDEAFGKKVIAAGFRSVQHLDADVVWYQRPSISATFRQFRGYGYGGGTSRSLLLLARDAIRVVGYGIAAALPLIFGWFGFLVSAIAATIYLSMPVARVIRRRQSVLLLPLLPLAYLLKDVAKVVGTAHALVRPRRARR